MYSIFTVATFIFGFLAIKNRTFSYGREITRIRDLDNLGVSNLKIKKDIADGLEISFLTNRPELEAKVNKYKITQILWVSSVLLSLIIILITSLL